MRTIPPARPLSRPGRIHRRGLAESHSRYIAQGSTAAAAPLSEHRPSALLAVAPPPATADAACSRAAPGADAELVSSLEQELRLVQAQVRAPERRPRPSKVYAPSVMARASLYSRPSCAACARRIQTDTACPLPEPWMASACGSGRSRFAHAGVVVARGPEDAGAHAGLRQRALRRSNRWRRWLHRGPDRSAAPLLAREGAAAVRRAVLVCVIRPGRMPRY